MIIFSKSGGEGREAEAEEGHREGEHGGCQDTRGERNQVLSVSHLLSLFRVLTRNLILTTAIDIWRRFFSSNIRLFQKYQEE